MILISPPDKVEISGPTGQPVDSMAMTKDAMSQPEIDSSKASPARQANTPAIPPIDPAIPPIDEEYRLAPEELPTQSSAAEFPTQWVPSAEPLLPTEEWSSASTARSKQYLLIGILGVGGTIVAAILFVVFLQWYGKSSTSEQLASGTPSEEQLASEDALPNVLEPEEEQPVQEADTAENSQAGSQDGLPRIDAPLQDTTEVANAAGAGGTETVEPIAGEDNPKLDTGGSIASDAADSEGVSEREGEKSGGDALPKRLQDFAQFLTMRPPELVPDTQAEISRPPITAEELGLGERVGIVAVPPINWEERATAEVQGLLAKDVPLWRMTNLLTNITGVPLVVAPDHLAAGSIDPSKPVSVDERGQLSVAQLTESFAKAIGCSSRPVENRFVEFVPSSEQLDKLPSELSVAGLVNGEEESAWFANAIQRLFPSLAEEVSLTGDRLQFKTDGSHVYQWFELIRTIEDWRSQQGLEPSIDLPEQARSQPFLVSKQVKGLDHRISGITPQAIPVAQLLSRACEEAGLECWIDWQNVGAGGLGPQTLGVFVTYARPLENLLRDCANEYGLVIAIRGERSIWITTNAAYRQQPQVYVMPSRGESVEDWELRLRLLATVGENQIERTEVVMTPDQAYVLVRCCRPTLDF